MIKDIMKPTPDEVRGVMKIKASRLATLDALPAWSNAEAEEVCSWLFNWNTSMSTWVYDRQAVERFAFDPRLPDGNATELQSILANFKAWMCSDDEYPTMLPLIRLLTANNLH